MKAAIADPHYRIHCIRIAPRWGDVIHLTDHTRDVLIGQYYYRTQSGYEFTGFSSEATMAPGVIDLSGIADIAGISYDQIVSGVFDNARVYCFATTWLNPIGDEEPLGVAFMGKITLRDNRYTAELMMMIDTLNQSSGETYTAACQKKFGGQGFAGCKIDLAPLTVQGYLTSVSSNSQFQDNTRVEPDDYFAEGTVSFNNGANAYLKPQMIKSYAGGLIVTHEPFYYPVAVDDLYTLIPGCRKRLVDCRDKWDNVINFGGFSFIPTSSQYQDRGLFK